MVQIPRQAFWKRMFGTARARRRNERSRPALEALETRALPSFGAPVSYNIGTQPTPAAKNSAAFDEISPPNRSSERLNQRLM